MGPTRKLPPQSTTTTQQMNQPPSSSSTPLTTQIPAGVSLGMSPASRYNHNIKVLRRRDPSIMSIFDQFSFVCLYHHDGEKWLKHGFEGTMFLFERNTYPPYGLYILNRVGSEDYIQAIYPEDELISSGAFLIIKSFPKFLAARLRAIQPTATGEPHDRFSDVYAVPGVENIPSKDKGPPTVISLWMLAVSSRDTMTQTMQRLHSYIRQNKPYPEELRYGPGKPPPPHSLRAATRPKAGSNSESESQQTSQSDSENDMGNHSDAPSATSNRLSEIDLLFQNLQTPSLPPTPSHIHQQPYEQQSTNISLNTLFASASSPSSGGSSPYATSNTGKSLLNTIFASAGSQQQQQQPAIYAPQPSTSAPQVLTQDVLSNLLGLPPTRTASAASSFSTSASAVSHPSSREGDNEDDGESESPGGLMDETPEMNQRRGLGGQELLQTLGLAPPRLGQHGKINGDVTPRGPFNNALQRPQFPSAIETASSISTVRADSAVAQSTPETGGSDGKPRANRTLVPFEPDSELWPYSRAPVEESSASEAGEDGEIVELSFEETSVLSDPAAFDKVLKNRRSAVSLRGQANGHGTATYQNGHAGYGGVDESPKGRKSKKSRKEQRDAKAKEELERSWDLPMPSPATNRAISHQDLMNLPPASPSPCPSPENQNYSQHQQSIPEMKTPTMNANVLLGHANGHGYNSNIASPNKGKGKAVPNGRAKANGHATQVDAEAVSGSLLAAVEAQPNPIGKMERNEFVKEVLTLIHTDKSFVDTLWQEYMARRV
ncbi:hypothetical protein JR316_0009944 [Psilocybe cubensis]|uniref:Uncharacterized protein n=2 Tax=Psilocybe cubensis TaxID=181762 RepID=A0ACB8GQ93_PSICU|nr:hypothetical protein JR316_0009944 [Psilocybe cubensis]KAH9477718.1 hypothetical protein JR316_0009944 [Psilocybe cubensis]